MRLLRAGLHDDGGKAGMRKCAGFSCIFSDIFFLVFSCVTREVTGERYDRSKQRGKEALQMSMESETPGFPEQKGVKAYACKKSEIL